MASNEKSSELGARPTIDKLVESFVAQLRAGESPSIEDYQKQHAHLAAEIGQLFPSLQMLEQCRPQEEDVRPVLLDAEDVPPDHLGDYRIIQEIGRGGMGIVYEADHVTMRRRVALKVLPKSIAQRSSNVDRFRQEARAAGQLHHTNIVPVFEVGEENGFHFYAMQFIRGQNLDLIVKELRHLRSHNHGRMPSDGISAQTEPSTVEEAPGSLSQTVAHRMLHGPDEKSAPEDSHRLANALDRTRSQRAAVPTRDTASSGSVFGSTEWSVSGRSRSAYFHRIAALGMQVADALSYAHQNELLHRDIKPSNLLLDTDGIVWVTDFGLAKGLEDALTQTGDIVGTLRYMAPERFQGQTDNRSDIYSLGLTLYELCTLEVAFQNTDRAGLVEQVTQRTPSLPRSIEPAIPRDLETIILKAIDRNPERRYRTARHLADDLQAFLADRPIHARRITTMERFWRVCRRNPITAALSACSLVLLMTVAVGSLIAAIQFRRQTAELQRQNERATGHLALTEETIEKMLNRVGHDLAGVPQMDDVRNSLFSEALELQKQVLELEPENPGVTLNTVAAYRRMALIQNQMGQLDAAQTNLEKNVYLLGTLPATSPDRQIELAKAYTMIGSLARAKGDMPQAEVHLAAAIRELQRINSADRDMESQLTLALAHRQLGAMQEQTGRVEEATTSLQSALDTMESIKDDTEHEDYLTTMADVLNSLAVVHRARGNMGEAESIYVKILDLCRTNVDGGFRQRDALDRMGISALNFGNLLMIQRRHAAAAEVYQQAADTFDRLRRDYPRTISFQEMAARSQFSLGMTYGAQDEMELAIDAYLRAIRQCDAIDELHGQTSLTQDTRAIALTNLGNLYKKQGRLGEAADFFEQSIVIRQARGKQRASDLANRKSLALTQANLAKLLADQDDYDRAQELFESAYQTIDSLIETNPDNPSYVRVADFICGSLGAFAAKRARYDEVEIWIERLAQLEPDDAKQQLKAVRELARAASLVREDSALDNEARKRQVASFADRAVRLLQRANELGWQPEADFADSETYQWLKDHPAISKLWD